MCKLYLIIFQSIERLDSGCTNACKSSLSFIFATKFVVRRVLGLEYKALAHLKPYLRRQQEIFANAGPEPVGDIYKCASALASKLLCTGVESARAGL